MVMSRVFNGVRDVMGRFGWRFRQGKFCNYREDMGVFTVENQEED